MTVRLRFLILAVVLLACGCKYRYPLFENQGFSLDPAVIGGWECLSDKDRSGRNQRMIILSSSGNEYLIHYPANEDGIYYRAYPLKVGSKSCVQIEVIGTKDGPPDRNEERLFHVVTYLLKDGLLRVSTLNPDLVKDSLKSSRALRKAFREHKNDKDLFVEFKTFRRVNQSVESGADFDAITAD